MSARRLTAADYAAPATELAPALVGKWLCRRTAQGVLRLRITETECYYGEEDTACACGDLKSIKRWVPSQREKTGFEWL